MAVSFVAASSLFSGFPSVTVASPAGTQVGDLLLAFVQQEGIGTSYAANTPTGWTLVGTTIVNAGYWRLFQRVADDPAASYTFTHPSTNNNDKHAVIAAFRGQASTPTVKASAISSDNTYATAYTPPNRVTAAAGDLVVTVAGAWRDGAVSTSAGFTVDFTYPGATNVTFANVIAQKEEAASGTASVPTFTSATDRYWGAFQLALSDNQPPNAPILTTPSDASTIDRSATQRFDWDFSDPDAGDTQSAYNLRYRVVGAATWTETGWISLPTTYHDIAGGTFADATDYEWQVATKDAQGVAGPYSSSWFFTAGTAPTAPTITEPTNGGTFNQTQTVAWSTPDQDAYQIRVLDASDAVIYDSGTVASGTARSAVVEFPDNGTTRTIQVRVQDGGLWSQYAEVTGTVSWLAPPTPTYTLLEEPAQGRLSVLISNPAPAGAEPATSYNRVKIDDDDGQGYQYRTDSQMVATNGTYIYWLARGTVDYSDKVIVEAVAENGVVSTSA